MPSLLLEKLHFTLPVREITLLLFWDFWYQLVLVLMTSLMFNDAVMVSAILIALVSWSSSIAGNRGKLAQPHKALDISYLSALWTH